MSKTRETHRMISRLVQAGIDEDDAWALRRIAMTLHRWHELECGTDRGAIERDEKTGTPYWYKPDIPGEYRSRFRIQDRETGALRRLGAIMARYAESGLSPYVQGDPRGAPLYILRPGDVPEGERPESYYSRGIAVAP